MGIYPGEDKRHESTGSPWTSTLHGECRMRWWMKALKTASLLLVRRPSVATSFFRGAPAFPGRRVDRQCPSSPHRNRILKVASTR